MLKKLIKAAIPESAFFLLRAARSRLDVLTRLDILEANAVRELWWRQSDAVSPRERLKRHEFRVFSQNGEDGILLYIFSQIGTTNRRFIEFGFADGRECNTANLSIHFGWSGLMLDGSEKWARGGRAYFGSRKELRPGQVETAQAFVTAENINELFTGHGMSGEIDLLSIDIDGNDYWVWKAIQVVTPRVVVIEYNASFTVERSVTIPYRPNFELVRPCYHGASLEALTRLGKHKGYSLVGCDSNGCNAFFVRDDVLRDKLPVLAAREAFYPQYYRNPDPEIDWRSVQDLPFAEV
jgi:hypothetical protein